MDIWFNTKASSHGLKMHIWFNTKASSHGLKAATTSGNATEASELLIT